MDKEEFDEMNQQMKENVCLEHGVPLIKSMLGNKICPFCEKEEWEE